MLDLKYKSLISDADLLSQMRIVDLVKFSRVFEGCGGLGCSDCGPVGPGVGLLSQM